MDICACSVCNSKLLVDDNPNGFYRFETGFWWSHQRRQCAIIKWLLQLWSNWRHAKRCYCDNTYQQTEMILSKVMVTFFRWLENKTERKRAMGNNHAESKIVDWFDKLMIIMILSCCTLFLYDLHRSQFFQFNNEFLLTEAIKWRVTFILFILVFTSNWIHNIIFYSVVYFDRF